MALFSEKYNSIPRVIHEFIGRKKFGFSGHTRSSRQVDRDNEVLRLELFSIEQLKSHARALAGRHRINPRLGPDRLLPRLADNERVLLAAYKVVSAVAAPGQRIVPAEVWLLDNFFLIEQQFSLARRHLPRGYSRQLPRLADGPSADFPRIYDLALEFITHMDGRVDSDNATQLIIAYQSAGPLKLCELWAFPIMLRLALLENLRRVGSRIARRRQEIKAAITWADRMLALEMEPRQLPRLLAEFASADVPLTAPFVEEFYTRLGTQEAGMAFIRSWVEQQLLDEGMPITQLSEMAARTAAADQISIANCISSLRFIGAMDWKIFVEALSVVEQTLRQDPAGMYADQDFATRDRYRHAIEDIAKAGSDDEVAVARHTIALAQKASQRSGRNDRGSHVGYYLIDDGRQKLEQEVGCRLSWKLLASRTSQNLRLTLYLGAILLLSVVATSVLVSSFAGLNTGFWQFWFYALTGIIASSSLAVPLVNLAVTSFIPPRSLPRLDFSKGIPAAHRTMVIVPTMIGSRQEIDDLLEALEIRYLGNRDPHLFFALLTDFYDAPKQTLPEDNTLLAHAREAVQTLNKTYQDDRPCIFYFFHRPRLWNPIEQVWMGYERKRGKLEQFNALLRGGKQTAFSDSIGDLSILPSIKYVITLDADTQLPRDAARALIGNSAHPLNQPVYDAKRKRIVAGYAIMQPRVSISLSSASRSRFAKLFAGDSGIDPYTREVSDVYQDIFAEGSFIGKGIYDVDAFRQAVDGRFPENLILSHDLLEGGYARSALVTDVELIEEHPASYTMEASRRHRWIRGDWQLAGWLLPRVPGPSGKGGSKGKRQANPLSSLSVWKIFDNLRRSLVPPALFALLAGGWLMHPESIRFLLLSVAAILFLPSSLEAAIAFLRKPEEFNWSAHLTLTGKSVCLPIVLSLLHFMLLPYNTLIYLDALLRSRVRMLFTRRGLLLWHLPSYAHRNALQSLADFMREMWVAPVSAGLLSLSLFRFFGDNRLADLLFLAPVLFLWLISPIIAWWISLPLLPAAVDLTVAQQTFLREAARRTWRYFAEFVGPQDNWLPPDNFQEYSISAVASRTSPTNIGMALLSNLAALDLGYIATTEFLHRTKNTIGAMERLERYRGHFYNWYDTTTLQPLSPQYVSSVDSGNLAGSILTLQAGLTELKEQPILSSNTFQGLRDTLQVLAGLAATSSSPDLTDRIKALQKRLPSPSLDTKGPTLAAARRLLDELNGIAEELAAWLPARSDMGGELIYWAHAFARQCRALLDDLQLLIPDGEYDGTIPTLTELAQMQAHGSAGPRFSEAVARLRIIDELKQSCLELAAMDFNFLYDTTRDLLAIGYDVGERRRDPSYYDLLASEARLASFLLIAQGQVPQHHWFSLGRLLTSHSGHVSLISWSGSMFEYLMPGLLMTSYENTLLDQTCKAAVSRQIEYGRQRAVPWGISESCYNATDMNQVYQYRAFGVPGLGFKRGLGDDLVIAPYASSLALTVMPSAACRNLQELAGHGFLGAYGFYEAVDYTPSRVPPDRKYAVVRAFMAHHQGMSLLAFEHVLLNRPMQRRFMSDPLVRATQLLLQERVPKQGVTLYPHAPEVSAAARPPDSEAGSIMRVFTNTKTPTPEVHLLSNGRYHVMATNSGGGYSRCRDLIVTRWREDATCDDWGTFIYLRDLDTGQYWSSAYHPTRREAEHYEAIFVQGRAEYRRRDLAIDTHTEISVSPEDDVEIRRVTLANLSSRTRHIEVTSYAEVVLAPLNADLSHRTFSNLFVQTEILPDRQAILCTRRRRARGEQTPWMFHLLVANGATVDTPSYETDRARFIGRGRTTANPVVLDSLNGPAPLSNTDGSVLDPIVAIRRTMTLLPDESASVQIISGVANTREAALTLLEKSGDRYFVERAFEMAWFHSQEVLRLLGITEADAQIFGRLASSVIYGNGLRRAAPSIISRNRLGQSGLWRFAISGDLPIILLHIGDLHRIDLVKQVLQSHAYWRMKGLTADLLIVNEDFSGYRAVLHDRIIGLIGTVSETQLIDKQGGIFVRRADEFSEEERILLQSVARIVFTDSADTVVEQLERRVSPTRVSDTFKPARKSPAVERVHPLPKRQLIFDNGLGGFTPDGREYVITLEAGRNTPAPWVNVIASPHIGTVTSESGSAYTWVENAHEFRLTTWHNDPVSDSSGEAFYIRDEETGAFWSPAPLPARGRSGYVCRHGFGYSVFEHYESSISSEMTIYVAMDAPVKFVVVKLRNQSGRPRRLSLTGYWELVLGEWRHTNMMHTVTEKDPHSGALFAHNAYCREYSERIVFGQVSEADRVVTGNRTEFIGRNGSLANPAAMHRKRLSGRTGAGFDPCAAMQTRIELADGQDHEIVFIFGAAGNADIAQQLMQRFSGLAGARQALEAVWEHWNHTLGAVQVETPDPALNVLANGWLIYQTLSCRLWGRSGYYQSGGAYGFRDQLQDTMALIHATPWLAREQLLRCAGRQFSQGDVQHWWHPPNGQGVRTHFSDDYLWLPYATCHYVSTTGDTGVLDESIHFLEGRELKPEEEAYYDQPQRSSESASLYEHCVRAMKHGLRLGVHHLPLMGCGDWNDGMNLVGRSGKGESVWLAWFLYENLRLFADLAHSHADENFAAVCTEQALVLASNIEAHAWDGEWYRRAWFDDGRPLGSSANTECQIDSISQSWAVISGGGDSARSRQAMAAVDKRLVRRDARLIQLLAPPFNRSDLEPGYIKGYVPGIRENGGQYSHAAIWVTMAFAMLGNRERAWELFAMLNPVNHGSSPEDIQRYTVEPYVMSADIYAAEPHTGRGGWTWYTGAAGWMYRLIVETLLGLRLEGDHLRIAPCIPADWQSYMIHYRYRETVYHIEIKRDGGKAEHEVRVTIDGVLLERQTGSDGTELSHDSIPLMEDRQEHHIKVSLGSVNQD